MFARIVSTVGVGAAVVLLYLATIFYAPGFDWSRHFVSTLLRGNGLSRSLAVAGVLLFCAALAMVMNRIAGYPVFAKVKQWVRIGGIGTMVYLGFAVTVLHDLVLGISLLFSFVTVVAMIRALWNQRITGHWLAGSLCLLVMAVSAYSYYAAVFPAFLPWGQRLSMGSFAAWALSLDWTLRSTGAELLRMPE